MGVTMSEKPARRTWAVDPGQAQIVLTGARNALFVMAGVIALIWIIQIANWADGYALSRDYGIQPRDVLALPYLLTAPFLHFSWTHIEGNSGPLFIFGFLAAYRGLAKFGLLSLIVILTSGFAAWFFEPAGSVGAGASGVVFGYLGYIIVRGLFDRRAIDVLVGAVMALSFAYQFYVLLPHQGIGWQAHVGGLVGGVAAGWLLRARRPAAAAKQAPAAAVAGRSAGKSVATKQSFAVDPSNPRADLYKELDDLGL